MKTTLQIILATAFLICGQSAISLAQERDGFIDSAVVEDLFVRLNLLDQRGYPRSNLRVKDSLVFNIFHQNQAQLEAAAELPSAKIRQVIPLKGVYPYRLKLTNAANQKSVSLTPQGQKFQEELEKFVSDYRQMASGLSYEKFIEENKIKNSPLKKNLGLRGMKNLGQRPISLSFGVSIKNDRPTRDPSLLDFFQIKEAGNYILDVEFMVLATAAYDPGTFVPSAADPKVLVLQTNGVQVPGVYIVNNVLCERPDGFIAVDSNPATRLPRPSLAPQLVKIPMSAIPVRVDADDLK